MSDVGIIQAEKGPTPMRFSVPSLLRYCVYWMIMVGAGITPSLAQETMIRVSTITSEAGQPFSLPIEGDWDGLLEGYSFSIAFPPTAPIENMVVDVYGSLVGSIEAEYVQEQVDPTNGTIICGVLFDALPPFDGQTVPSLGYPQEIAYLLGEISAGSLDQDIEFSPQDGFGTPPIMNMFVIGSGSVSVSSLVSGTIEVRSPPVEPIFIRGDVNMDTLVDLADPIYHLDYTFLDGPLPSCMDAGDANDDGISDISDAIFLLYYFFIGGPGPWVPFPNAGIDWTDDNLDCDIGL